MHFEKVVVCYEAPMMPVFIKLNEHDKLTSPMDALQDDRVADWVEERLLEFIEAYQGIACECPIQPLTKRTPMSGPKIVTLPRDEAKDTDGDKQPCSPIAACCEKIREAAYHKWEAGQSRTTGPRTTPCFAARQDVGVCGILHLLCGCEAQ